MAEQRRGARPTGEVVLAFPARTNPVRHVRSTLLMATMASLKSEGRFDAYCQAIAPAHRDALLHAVAAGTCAFRAQWV